MYSRKQGLVLVIIGASLWGLGGTVSQQFMQKFNIDVNWLVTTRLLIAGLLLLCIQALFKDRSTIFSVWKNRKIAIHLITFGLIGMLGVQYTYLASIKHGNAAVATLLQYLSPLFIILYLLIRKQLRFKWLDVFIFALALIGCFLLLTNGSFNELRVSTTAILWGIGAGLAAAFYTLYGAYLLKHFDTLLIVGWAMIIGGIGLSFIHPPWDISFANFTVEAISYYVFIIVFGTMMAFWFFIDSLQVLTPKEASLFGSLEPLWAVFSTVLWLKEPFGTYQWIGTLCIITIVLIVATQKREVTSI